MGGASLRRIRTVDTGGPAPPAEEISARGAAPMRAVASLLLPAALCVASPASAQTAQAPFGDVAHHVARVDGMRFHYVVAGSGEPVVLLPGWPEMSWIAWRKVIPLLVKAGRQVYVLEPRGFGDSDKPE